MEENFKNKIITISGEPASGKGTVVKLLKQYYEEQGYDVHVISVGDMFREISIEEYKKAHPEVLNPSIEQVNNDKEFMEQREEIDSNIDSYIAQKGKEINSVARPNDVYILDSRLAFSNIPDSFAIRLTVDEKVAGQRVFDDETRGNEDKYDTLEQAIEDTEKRKEGEISRYKERYGVDLTDENNYNVVINTSFAKPQDTVDVITKSLELAEQRKYYPRTWASPKWFLPMQSIMETARPAGADLDINAFGEKLKEEGYDFSFPIDVIQVDGYYYIYEGHHRNFAAGEIGMTLVPYDLLAKDDELIPGFKNSAKERVYINLQDAVRQSFLTRLYDHEGFFDEKDENGEKKHFYYKDVYGEYPDIPESRRKENSEINEDASKEHDDEER